MTAPPAVDAVRAALPRERERPADQYPIDGATPALAVRPQTREELASLLAVAADAGLAVVPQGGRTALALGRPLAHYDVALDVRGLDRVVAYEPNDLTVTVEAGLTLEALQTRLAEHGQYLSVDPPPDGDVTVGGLLATARPGAWRGHLPGQRDLVLGVTAALPDGALVSSGGRVVKNVSGYDMHRMHTGALGAFGVIVEASFKLAPLPPATRSAAVRCATAAQAEAVAFDLWDRALGTRAISLLSPRAAAAAALSPDPHALVEFAGSGAAVERSLDELNDAAALAQAPHAEEISGEVWTRLRALAGDAGAVVMRLGVPPSALAATIEAATHAGCTAWGHLAAGSVLAHAPSLDAGVVRALRETAAAAGGFLQLEAASASLRSAVDPFDASERDLVRSLKQQFDPAGTLNPGRWMDDV